MVKKSKKSLTSTLALAKIISKLKSPDSIVSLIQRLDDKTINQLVGLIANLIHNKQFQSHPLLSRKLKPLRKKMHSSASQWLKLVKNPSGNPRSKRSTLIKQAGSGSLWQIISSVLPVLISLVLWTILVLSDGGGVWTPQKREKTPQEREKKFPAVRDEGEVKCEAKTDPRLVVTTTHIGEEAQHHTL